MSEQSTNTRYIRITGTNAFGQSIEMFYKGELKEAERAFLLTPPEQGGPTSWSTEELESLPERVYITCPHCEGKFLDPNIIKDA